MQHKEKAAGPVATGTDGRHLVLANETENSLTPLDLQVRQLSRRAALSVATASMLAPFVFGEVRG